MFSQGGYDVNFEKELDEKYVCPLCKLALKDPVQTQCGHRFCNSCIEPILRNPHPKCPLDKEPLSPKDVFNDVCCKREVSSLKCFCLNNKLGCDWLKELMYLEEHLPQCEYREVPCENVGCREKIPKKKLSQHMKETCAFKQTTCQYCQESVPEKEMGVHLQLNCKKFPITCRYCGMTGILREEEDDHVTNDCEAAEKPCQFKSVGCCFQGTLESLNAHYEAQKDEHLKLTVESMKTRKQEEEELKVRIAKVENTNKSLEKQLSEHRETLATTTQNVTMYQARLSKAEKNISEHKRAISQIRERTEEAASSKALKPNEITLQLDEIRIALSGQEDKLNSFERELARGSAVGAGPRSMSSGSLTLDRRLDRNEHQLALHDIQLAEHDLKIQMLEATSYNGTYIWKIDEFTRRNHEGIIGKTPSIYSPPFYVGRYGYKVCARVYPNGDGMGKGTHLSLFFVIMKGEYDPLLPWPFRQKVTFKLLDQDRQQDVTDTFRPDPNSSSFKRPSSNMNIASGCPLFVSQQVLQSRSYVKDDTMFIKIIVETAGLPPLGF